MPTQAWHKASPGAGLVKRRRAGRFSIVFISQIIIKYSSNYTPYHNKIMSHEKKAVYTIGHSTHTLPEFIQILKAYSINYVVDIRTIPRSLHNPQFNSDTLEKALKKEDILYYHFKELGGFRHAKTDSQNMSWHNASFRGYADYMQTKDFKHAITILSELAKKYNIVLMCAEAVPWRCHRSLIGDALVARKFEVIDIFSATNSKPHKLTPWAQVTGTQVTYP
jgi:uncharacterized protein (DUF488 family)